MTQVTFPKEITGRTADTTYSDDNTPGTGMADGGHQELWIPLMQDVVAATQYIATYATAIDTADENAAAALLSEQHAATSENNAASSAAAALSSQTAAATSAAAALSSQNAAKTSETNAATSASHAATSETNAANSAATAAQTVATAAANAVNAAAASAASAQASAATAISAPGTQASSTSTLTLATGLQNLTVQTGKQLAIGMSVKIADSTDGSRWLHGDIADYNSSTGQLSVNVQTVRGTGTGSSWIVSLSAPGSLLPYTLADGTTVTIALW